MVLEEVVNFRIQKALYDMGQAIIDTGGAESLSSFAASAVSNQIGIDLKALNASLPFTTHESKTGYSKGRGSEWQTISVRVHKSLLKTIEILINEGAAENRSEYFRRAYTEEIRRDRERPKYMDEKEIRRISMEVYLEMKKIDLERQIACITKPPL